MADKGVKDVGGTGRPILSEAEVRQIVRDEIAQHEARQREAEASRPARSVLDA